MLIAGNWKMFKGPAEAAAFCRALRDVDLPADVDVVVCPPYVSLEGAVQALAGHRDRRLRAELPLGRRGRVHRRDLRARCCCELGVYGTIVGHSERRQLLRRDRRDRREAHRGRARRRAST